MKITIGHIADHSMTIFLNKGHYPDFVRASDRQYIEAPGYSLRDAAPALAIATLNNYFMVALKLALGHREFKPDEDLAAPLMAALNQPGAFDANVVTQEIEHNEPLAQLWGNVHVLINPDTNFRFKISMPKFHEGTEPRAMLAWVWSQLDALDWSWTAKQSAPTQPDASEDQSLPDEEYIDEPPPQSSATSQHAAKPKYYSHKQADSYEEGWEFPFRFTQIEATTWELTEDKQHVKIWTYGFVPLIKGGPGKFAAHELTVYSDADPTKDAAQARSLALWRPIIEELGLDTLGIEIKPVKRGKPGRAWDVIGRFYRPKDANGQPKKNDKGNLVNRIETLSIQEVDV